MDSTKDGGITAEVNDEALFCAEYNIPRELFVRGFKVYYKEQVGARNIIVTISLLIISLIFLVTYIFEPEFQSAIYLCLLSFLMVFVIPLNRMIMNRRVLATIDSVKDWVYQVTLYDEYISVILTGMNDGSETYIEQEPTVIRFDQPELRILDDAEIIIVCIAKTSFYILPKEQISPSNASLLLDSASRFVKIHKVKL